MNYYEAAKIRKKGFADLMTDKLTSGQGVFSSVRSTLSDRSKARSMAFKEKFDPLNIAKVLTGGERADLGGELAGGFYVMPTIFEGNNKMRIFQEEIFGPVVSVTKFDGFDNAMEIANDTLYGLGAGVWTRDMNTAYRAGRAIQAGRVWTNCYHAYPAGAAFGGYKASGIGRENHKMMLDHYQQTKNLLVSYSPNKLGFF